jgi:site-specific DNA-methyltransferase (adenine-specific)
VVNSSISDSDLTAADTLVFGDSLDLLQRLPDGSVDLVYIDPPFNTGKVRTHTQIRATRDDEGDRTGFQGRRYRTEAVGTRSYPDAFEDFQGFLSPRLKEIHRVLASTGSFFLHLDYRESHYCKVALDGIFGRESFINEIIWAYDYGGRPKNRWPAKHDTILWYAKNPRRYTFNYDAIDRIPYMAPNLVGAEKAERGKTPTDVWWHTIVPTNGKERTGYPTQKPLGVLKRLLRVHTSAGDLVVDCFAGSGTTGEAAARLGRRFVIGDTSEDALAIMQARLAFVAPRVIRLRADGEESVMESET